MNERELELRQRLVEYQANVCCGILNDVESALAVYSGEELKERIRALVKAGRETVAFGAGV